jgi:NAD+ diphosphatase
MQEGGWRRGCGECGAFHFPRTDPVVIMLVLSGERALLGRQAVWPDRMYSLLAGYMEPGETIEEAVRRETMEEAGVPVGAVRYVCSQPWPFPSSLMIACVAEALDERIHRADAELEDALWADRAEVAASLRGEPARFTAARRGAVARTLLQAWVEDRLPRP